MLFRSGREGGVRQERPEKENEEENEEQDVDDDINPQDSASQTAHRSDDQ